MKTAMTLRCFALRMELNNQQHSQRKPPICKSAVVAVVELCAFHGAMTGAMLGLIGARSVETFSGRRRLGSAEENTRLNGKKVRND